MAAAPLKAQALKLSMSSHKAPYWAFWAGQIFALWAIARAAQFEYSGSQIAYLLVVRSVGTLIPNAPANMGLYQAATVYVLAKQFLTEPAQAQILAEAGTVSWQTGKPVKV